MQVTRRALVAGIASTSLVAACARKDPPHTHSPGPSPSPSSSPTHSGAGEFGLVTPSSLNVLLHSGPFGTSLTDAAVRHLQDAQPGLTITTAYALDIAREVGTDLSKGGFDLIHNGGTRRVHLAKVRSQLAELDPLLDAPNLAGQSIRDSLFTAALPPLAPTDTRVTLPYTLIARGLWYSEPAFAKRGILPPTTWEELLALGKSITDDDLHLFAWDEHSVGDYLEMAITIAIKDGGHALRIALDSLAEDAWSHPRVQATFTALAQLVESGQLVHTTGATSRWATGDGPLLTPASARIVRQTSGVRPDEFQPVVAPVPSVTGMPALPQTAIHADAADEFLVPTTTSNKAAAFELLRTMYSPEIATEFSRINEVPTVVRGTSQGIDSAPLHSQARLIAGAGKQAFSWRFIDHYGLGQNANEAMTALLAGKASAQATLKRLQSLCDKVRNDSSMDHYTVR